jgi:hemoglobin
MKVAAMAQDDMNEDGRIARPARVGPGAALGVTEAMIHDVVHTFYAKIRPDPTLGPIFERVIGDNWDVHLAKMCDFWSSVLLMTGRFKGTPMVAHARIHEIEPAHFARWLDLFRQKVTDLCPPAASGLFIEKADMIARSLQLGIATARGGELLTPIKEKDASLPVDAHPYRRTDVFTQDTVPAGLLKSHATKEGVWGLIHVIDGRLALRITDPRRPPSRHELTPESRGLIEPTITHEVEPLGPVRFFVEFHRRKET